MQSFPEGGEQMDRLPAVVMGGPESAKKGLPHTGMRDQCNFSGGRARTVGQHRAPLRKCSVLFKLLFHSVYI